jgi:small-conductance mechanosensitive channel
MLLRESLSNNGTTVMIACVSPSSEYLSETTNTLTFATKAANITRQVVVKVTDEQKEKEALRADVIRYKKRCDILEEENSRLKELLTNAGIKF